jgi:hypothetical protein
MRLGLWFEYAFEEEQVRRYKFATISSMYTFILSKLNTG